MSTIAIELLLGIACAAVGGALSVFIVLYTQTRGIMGRSPKRLDRLENVVPLILRILINVLDTQRYVFKCIQAKSCNGELKELEEIIAKAKADMDGFLTGASVSQPAKAP